MSQTLEIIIVEKTGTLKSLIIKDFKETELYKKCGFKKEEGFMSRCNWNVKYNGIKYIVSVFAKVDGRANSENKYDFPPPIDVILFYGNCAIVAKHKTKEGDIKYINLTLECWNKIYEKLFGGFEDLAATALEDEEEEDELENVPSNKKTKHGYLKDGFVVESDGEEDTDYDTDTSCNDETEDDIDEPDAEKDEGDLMFENIGSELSEESYD